MLIIPDDPLIAWAMRTGYPPWIRKDPPTWGDEEDDADE